MPTFLPAWNTAGGLRGTADICGIGALHVLITILRFGVLGFKVSSYVGFRHRVFSAGGFSVPGT